MLLAGDGINQTVDVRQTFTCNWMTFTCSWNHSREEEWWGTSWRQKTWKLTRLRIHSLRYILQTTT